MHKEHLPGDPLFYPPSKFDIWMETEGRAIIQSIMHYPKNKCYVCPSRKNITCHHIIPIHCGGRDVFDNIVHLCKYHHEQVHRNNRDQPTDKDWFLIIKKMKNRNIYKPNSNSNNNKEVTK